MTSLNKRVSIEGNQPQIGNGELDEALFLNRLLHDTRRKAQSVLKKKQLSEAPGSTKQSPVPNASKALDIQKSGNRANSMLDQIDSRTHHNTYYNQGFNNERTNMNGTFQFNQTFRPFGTDVMPGYTLKSTHENETEYYSPFKNKLRK